MRTAITKDELERVRLREEARLIKIAKSVGFFKVQLTTPQIKALLRDGLEQTGSHKKSQLRRMENEMALEKQSISKAKRNLDARRKILLGSFILAQIDHKPALKAQLIPELEKFLDTDKNADRASANKQILADILYESSKPSVNT